MFKDIKKIVIFPFISFLFLSTKTFADLDEPTFENLQTPVENTFNIVFSLVGIVLVAMLAYGIWKSSMSLGDPRGLEGAKQTWSYAFYGFAVIVIFFLLFSFLTSIFGIETLVSPKHILDKLFGALGELLDPVSTFE